MFGTDTFMKLIHYKDIKVKIVNSTAADSSKDIKQEKADGMFISSPHIDFEHNNFEDSLNMCRVCLQLPGKIDIFGNYAADNIADSVNTFGGIQVSTDDPYPKKICKACYILLDRAILFRKTAQQSDEQLKKYAYKPIWNEYEHESDSAAVEDNKVLNYKSKQNDHFSNIYPILKKSIERSVPEVNQDSSAKDSDKPINNLFKQKRASRKKNNKQEESYVCEVCGTDFVLRASLMRHRLRHVHDLPFKCSLCPYKGRLSQSLKMHMRSHTGERPYPCSECSARFISKSNLIKHMRIHKTRDFMCEMCPRGFYVRQELEEHINSIHKGIRDHFCSFCDKAFGHRKQMMKHERTVHKRKKLRSGKMPTYLQLESMKQQNSEEAPDT